MEIYSEHYGLHNQCIKKNEYLWSPPHSSKVCEQTFCYIYQQQRMFMSFPTLPSEFSYSQVIEKMEENWNAYWKMYYQYIFIPIITSNPPKQGLTICLLGRSSLDLSHTIFWHDSDKNFIFEELKNKNKNKIK